MRTSESTKELAAALAKAQGEMHAAVKDSDNPFFKSRYADLASAWTAARAPLAKNGLSVAQGVEVEESEGGLPRVKITTKLLHASGEWLDSTQTLLSKDVSAQGIGSA